MGPIPNALCVRKCSIVENPARLPIGKQVTRHNAPGKHQVNNKKGSRQLID